GRYLVTGSVRGDLDSPTWPGTGRLVRIPMYGLTAAEILRRTPRRPFLDRVAEQGTSGLPVASDRVDLRDYVELALRSGFPQAALTLPERFRQQWLDSYVSQLLSRDLSTLGERRDPERVGRYLESHALHTAGVVEHRAIYEAAGITRMTADS